MVHELVIDGGATGRRRQFTAPPDFTGHPEKSGYRWLPVEEERAAFDPATEVPTAVVKTVEAARVLHFYGKRAKTAGELRSDRIGQLIAVTGDNTVLLIRLIQQLLADNTIQAADFTAEVRATYQSSKVIADLLDSPGA